MLTLAGAMVACQTLSRAQARPVVIIEMKGSPRGERIWFDPIGVAVAPGTLIRFVNRDLGSSHTATSYHPSTYGRVTRIPGDSAAWNSGFLLPNQNFDLTLSRPGVYDYFCLPHEAAAMVGRIVVGTPADLGWSGASTQFDAVSKEALRMIPAVEDILRLRKVSLR